MIEHVDPDLSVIDDTGRDRLGDRFSRCDRRDSEPGVFQEFTRGFPAAIQTVFEAANRALLFKRAQSARPVGKSITQGRKTAGEAVDLVRMPTFCVYRIGSSSKNDAKRRQASDTVHAFTICPRDSIAAAQARRRSRNFSPS